MVRVEITRHPSTAMSPDRNRERSRFAFGGVDAVLDPIHVALFDVDVLGEVWHHWEEGLDHGVVHAFDLLSGTVEDLTTARGALPIQP